jgi:integrase
VYYFRSNIPTDLIQLFGRSEIARSLQTSDFPKAKRLCAIESVKFDAFCESMRAKRGRKSKQGSQLTDDEINTLVSRYFINEERLSERWAENDLPNYSESERDAAKDSYAADTVGLFHEVVTGDPTNDPALKLAEEFLSRHGELEVDKNGHEFKRLAQLLRRAQVESLNRRITRLENQPVSPFNHEFAHLSARTQVPPLPKRKVTLLQLTERFMVHKRKTTGENTPITYAIPIRILLEVLGPQRIISDINQEDIRRVGESLEKIPSHVSQKYPRLKLLNAIQEADAEGNKKRLTKQTVTKYYSGMSAVFNWAVEEGLIENAPTKGRNIRKEFAAQVKKVRPPFTATELKALFASPIFTGCIDDGWHANTHGETHPRRGKFWIPLLSLFHGARLNELCQLYCQDIKEEDGIPYFHIRTEFDEEDKTERRIKTQQSRRKVPIHSKLIRLGFLEFVKQRSEDGKNPRLFPEIVLGQATKRYSSAFSQWFGRYHRKQQVTTSKATFHSFRHNFRTALSKAGVPIEYADTICGWGSQSMERNYFHPELKSLQEAIEKVTYPNLDLSSLKVFAPMRVSPPARLRIGLQAAVSAPIVRP